MSEATILNAIRRGLKRGKLSAEQTAVLNARLLSHPRHLMPARGQLDRAGRIAMFGFYLEREFGTVARVTSADAVPGAVLDYLARQNLAAAIVVSPHPALRAIRFDSVPMLDVRFGVCGPEDPVCLTHAFAGIAETGTLMLPSGPERPTSNNLLPDNAIAVLNADDIVGAYEEAFDRLRAAGPLPRNVMLVTGPSRSADIEQTLELGAHGPRRLHVVIIDGEA